MFDKGTCTTLFVTILGLVCATLTPLGKLPAVEELNGIYLYAVISLLASSSSSLVGELQKSISKPGLFFWGLDPQNHIV